MKYLLDTDSVSFLFAKEGNEHELITQKFAVLDDEDIVQVSFMTIFELEYSFSNANDNNKKAEIRETIEQTKRLFQIVPLKIEFAETYGEIKTQLKNYWGSNTKAMKKHNVDLLIASTSLIEKSTLIAHDTIYKDLAEINSQFQYENWTT